MMPNDFGPIYSETDLSRFPVEPWNTWSNIGFLLVLIFWSKKTKCDFRSHPLIVGVLPLLLIGLIGGTIFHATRAHRIWLILDFTPIFLIAIAISLNLWRRVTGSLLSASSIVTACVVLIPTVLKLLLVAKPIRIAIGYLSIALTVILPASIVANSTKDSWPFLRVTILSLFLALTFRQADKLDLLPMGTHFLWHLLGAYGVHYLFSFLYHLDIKRAERGSAE